MSKCNITCYCVMHLNKNMIKYLKVEGLFYTDLSICYIYYGEIILSGRREIVCEDCYKN